MGYFAIISVTNKAVFEQNGCIAFSEWARLIIKYAYKN